MHKSCSHASHRAHEQRGERRREKLRTKATGKTHLRGDKSGGHSGGRLEDDEGCVTRSVRYVCGGVVKQVELKIAVLRIRRLEGILKGKLEKGMPVYERLVDVAGAKPPGSKAAVPKDSKPGAPADARPIPVRVSLKRPNPPVPCKAGSACKRLLRKNAERDRLQAERISAKEENYEDVSDVPLEEYCDDSSDSERSKPNSGASGPRLPPPHKRRRAMWLEDLDDVSDTPLEQYDDDVPETDACHSPSLSKVKHEKATVEAPRQIDELKVKGSTRQGEQLNKEQQRSSNKDEKKMFLEPSMSVQPEAANIELAKRTCNATVEPQSNGTKVCAVTTVKLHNKSSLALATGKDVIEKKALKRLGTPCKNENVKKVKSDSGTVKSTTESCVGAGKKSSSQSPAVKVSQNQLVKSLVSHAKHRPKTHTATSDNRCATQETPGLKSEAGTIAARVGSADDSNLSVAKKARPDKLAKKPESSARGSSDMPTSNLSISAKCLPTTTQMTTNDRPETKKAASVTGHHSTAGSSAAENILPDRLAQKPGSCTKSTSASNQSNSTQAVPSSTVKTAKDAAQAKAGCIPDTTLQNINSSVTKKVLPKIPKKSMSSKMSTKSDASTLKKEAFAKAPTSTSKFVKNAAETKVGRSSGTDLQTTAPPVSKQAPSLNKMVNRQVSCAKSSEVSASKPPSPVSIPKKLLTFASKTDRGALPSIPAKKSAPCVNSNASEQFEPEKMAKMDKTIQSDLKTEHKKCSDGHSGTLGKEQVTDNAANHGSKTTDSSKLCEMTTGKHLKNAALGACVTTVQVKISRSKLTGCPDISTPPSELATSAESLLLEQSKQQLSKLPERTPLLEQTDCPVRSFPELGTSLPKACDMNLPQGGYQASIVPETTIQAEAAITATSGGPHGTTEMPTDAKACLGRKAQTSEQPAKNVADSVSETVFGSNGLHTHEKTGTSQNICISKLQEPMTEVRELVADVIVQVVSNLGDLADIGAEVECGDDCVHENSVTIHRGDQGGLPQDSCSVTDGLATSAESNAVGTSGPKLLTDATENAPLEQKVENASEVVDKDAMTLPCKLDNMEGVGTVALSPEQVNGPSIEEEECSVLLANCLASEMPPTTGDCDGASNVLPKSRCLQDSAGKEDPGAPHNDSRTPTHIEHSLQEPRILLSQRPGSEATTVAKEIRESESLAVREGIREEKTAVSQELVASKVAVEAMRSSHASMCATNDERSCQQQPENANRTLQEVHTDNTALSTTQKSVGGEVPDEKKDDGTNACAAHESSEQQAEVLSADVPQDKEGTDTVEAMDVDNCMHNENSSSHSQVDEPISRPKELQESSGSVTMPGSSNGICDEGSSTETSDTLLLLSEGSVEDASQPAIAVAGAPKPSSHSKKKRNRSAGTNTSLCSAWVFSRNRRGKQKHSDRQYSSSGGRNSSSTSTLASALTEAAAGNTGKVADVPARDIRKTEAAPQIKKEPAEVNACGNMPVSSDARKPPCASAVRMERATKDPKTASYKQAQAPFHAAPHAKVSSFVHGALLDLDMFTGLSILDICGSGSTTDLKDLKARIMNHTITKNNAVAEIARSVRTAVVDEYFKGERAVRTLQLLSKIPFSLEPTKVHKIRELTQAVVGKSESFTKLQL